MRKAIIGAALALVLSLSMHASQAQSVIGIEDEQAGFVGAILTSQPPILVASDGETPFDPFGAGFNCSDGIRFPDVGWQIVGGGWLEIAQTPGFKAWVLPEGIEGDPEPVGHWLFPGAFWNPDTPENQVILEPDGQTVSDFIHVYNTREGANVTFQSGVSSVPEGSSVAMLFGGLAPAAWFIRRRNKK